MFSLLSGSTLPKLKENDFQNYSFFCDGDKVLYLIEDIS